MDYSESVQSKYLIVVMAVVHDVLSLTVQVS